MKKTKYTWKMPQNIELPDAFIHLLEQEQLNIFLGQILWNRGIQTAEQLEAYIHPSMEELHDPFLMHDMQRGIERIQTAVENDEQILIYGDYDADGITSTTLMKEAIELIGGNVDYFLPNRFVHGYGPNQIVFEEKIASGTQLIITVDNGVAGNEAISFAMSQGIDVIVTDHHELPPTLPDAFAIIHPKHPAGSYPFGELAGVGVAFKVATALLGEIPAEFLDLVAIGTVADLVSLTGENRVLVKMGLEILRTGERIGLDKLILLSDKKKEAISEEDIAFSFAPRLNALGRLGDASPGVELLSTFDENKALEIAIYINEKNDKRKEIVNTITSEASKQVNPQDLVHILVSKGWHEGVLGIVAGRIVQETGKPTIVLTIDEEGKHAKGSGRSVANFNMYQALNEMRQYFIHFGGHHMAVGLTMAVDTISEFKQQLTNYIEKKQIDLKTGQELAIDASLSVKEASISMIEQVKRLAPFGTDNPIPTFLFKDVNVLNARQIGSDKSHLKCIIDQSENTLDAIAFQMGSQLDELTQSTVNICGQLSINEWNGHRKPQLMVTDFSVTGIQLFDFRGKRADQKKLPTDDKTLYIYFDKQSKKFIQSEIITPVLFTSIEEIIMHIKKSEINQLVFVDCPTEPLILKMIIQKSRIKRIYFIGYSHDEAYLTGIASRAQFAQLYTFINQQKQVDVRYKLTSVAQYLNIREKLLIFMIQVFFDLEFVTIENGILEKVANPKKNKIEDSEFFKQRLKKIKAEEFLLYNDRETLQKWLGAEEEEIK